MVIKMGIRMGGTPAGEKSKIKLGPWLAHRWNMAASHMERESCKVNQIEDVSGAD